MPLHEDILATIVDVADAIVVVLDANGRIEWVNRMAREVTGYSGDELRGRHAWELLLPEEAGDVRRVFDDLKSGHFPSTHENYWVARDGSRRLIHWSNTAVTTDGGEVGYVIGTGIDITDLASVRRERDARERAVSRIRHDLANALSSMSVGTKLALGHLADEAAAATTQADLERLRDLIGSMRRLLDQLESDSAGISDEAEDIEPLSPWSLVHVSVRLLEGDATDASLELVTRVPRELPPVLANADRVGQVLTNIIGNALKFTPPGGEVVISAARDEPHVRFVIEDSGPGLSEEALVRAFDEGWQEDALGAGNGLGLSIAREIVEDLGGRIWAESEPGAGSRFLFTLPVAGTDTSRVASDPNEDHGGGPAGRERPRLDRHPRDREERRTRTPDISAGRADPAPPPRPSPTDACARPLPRDRRT